MVDISRIAQSAGFSSVGTKFQLLAGVIFWLFATHLATKVFTFAEVLVARQAEILVARQVLLLNPSKRTPLVSESADRSELISLLPLSYLQEEMRIARIGVNTSSLLGQLLSLLSASLFERSRFDFGVNNNCGVGCCWCVAKHVKFHVR